MTNSQSIERLTTAELATYLGKSEAWCERKRWDGTGPTYTKIGRTVYYFRADVDAWIVAQRRTWTRGNTAPAATA